MTAQPAATPLEALLAKVDIILRRSGADPTVMNDDDKILLAAQYIEVEDVLGILVTRATHKRMRL